jgi:ABC-type transport system involved in multi-copper enzyme maturation permease subunit
MLKALLWKEWHEQRGRVVLACVWLLGPAVIVLKTRIMPDTYILGTIGLLAAVILPAFVGMGLFTSERRQGTLAYLTAQPVGRGQILAAKLIVGLLAYVIPMIGCGLAVCLAVGSREIDSAELMGRVIDVIAFGVVLLSWELQAGLRCRREETYILACAMILGFWIVYDVLVEAWNLMRFLGIWTWAVDPFNVMRLINNWEFRSIRETWTMAAMQTLILVGSTFALWLRFRKLREGKS